MQASRGRNAHLLARTRGRTYDPSVVTSPESAPPPPPPARRSSGSRAGSAIVFVLTLLFLGDTLLAWQRACVAVPGGLPIIGSYSLCVRVTAWHGTAAGLGAIAGVAAVLLLLWEGVRLAGVDLDLGVDHRVVTTVLAGAIVVSAALKWALVLGNFAGPGAWLGLLLAAVLAAWVTLQPRSG